jgi:hypothetical protein
MPKTRRTATANATQAARKKATAVKKTIQKPRKSQDCQAMLRINGQNYDGSTGRGNGHAEMDALHNFIMEDPGNLGSVKASIAHCATLLRHPGTPKSVSCPSRPCCKKCSKVLKSLGFVLAAGSHWSSTSMGSTEWGASQNVRQLLKLCGVDYDAVKALS